MKTCFLWVNDANEPALALYDGLGYRFDGRRAVELTKGMEVSAEQIKQIVENVNPSALNSDGLIEEGALDSLDIVTLVLQEAFGISIDVCYITPENFSNIDAMAAFLRKAQSEG